MTGDSGFLQTQRVLRSGLPPNAKLIQSLLWDEVGRLKAQNPTGPPRYPEWSLAEFERRTQLSRATVKRTLRLLEVGGFVRRVEQVGRPCVYVPCVPGTTMPAPEPRQGVLPMPARELVPQAVSRYAQRGTQGRFVAAEDAGDFHRSGQIDPTSEATDGRVFHRSGQIDPTSDAPEGAIEEVGRVKLTRGSGQIDPTPSSLTVVRTDQIRSVRTEQENARAVRAEDFHTSGGPTVSADLPLVGLSLSPEERRMASRDPAPDANYKWILGRALELGRANPPSSELELRDRIKDFAAQHGVEYGLTTPDGQGVVHMAVMVAWKVLLREGVVHEEVPQAPERRRHGGTKGGVA